MTTLTKLIIIFVAINSICNLKSKKRGNNNFITYWLYWIIRIKIWKDLSINSGVNCKYLKNVLSCNNTIECTTSSNFDGLLNNSYELFGIEALDSFTLFKIRYKLFPKNLTDQSFADSLVTTSNGTVTNLVLYHSDISIEPGLMVKDYSCFNKLVDYFTLTNFKISVNKKYQSSTSRIFIHGLILTV